MFLQNTHMFQFLQYMSYHIPIWRWTGWWWHYAVQDGVSTFVKLLELIHKMSLHISSLGFGDKKTDIFYRNVIFSREDCWARNHWSRCHTASQDAISIFVNMKLHNVFNKMSWCLQLYLWYHYQGFKQKNGAETTVQNNLQHMQAWNNWMFLTRHGDISSLNIIFS